MDTDFSTAADSSNESSERSRNAIIEDIKHTSIELYSFVKGKLDKVGRHAACVDLNEQLVPLFVESS